MSEVCPLLTSATMRFMATANSELSLVLRTRSSNFFSWASQS